MNTKQGRKERSEIRGSTESKDGKLLNNAVVVICVVLVAMCNYYHVSYMQENHLMFSHLSTMEREMSFRTEMGFYYSFYKQVIEAPSLSAGVHLLIHDNFTEHPHTINALQRFNVYPEFVVAILFRAYTSVCLAGGVELRVCYSINRQKLPPVQSCEGLGEPAIFYVHTVILLNSAMLAALFLLGRFVSGHSVLGGVVTTLLFFYNHRECTRVQWTPPLRESFSYPFLLIQQLFLLQLYTNSHPSKTYQVSKYGYFITTLMALLSWQFAQFALLTQCIAVFMAYIVAGDNCTKIVTQKILSLLLVADLINVILQFGNTLLLVGPLRPCITMALIIITLEPSWLRSYFHNRTWAPIRWMVLSIILLLSTFILKSVFSVFLQINSDDHMLDILRSKFSDFRSFDSLLYTCAPEFDFYDMSSLRDLCYSGLLPISASVLLIIVLYTVTKWLQLYRSPTDISLSGDNNFLTKSDLCTIGTFYLLFQTIAYTIMSSLIMRLKLFWTPHLCIVAAFICHRRWPIVSVVAHLPVLGKTHHIALLRSLRDVWPVVLIIALCSVKGVANLRAEWAIHGSYSNWEQEQLMGVIMDRTHSHDSFVGQMATMATVRLVTGRRITMHPHFEDEHLRSRVHMSYSVYSRKSVHDVWLMYRSKLQATHFIYESSFCALKLSKPGCSYLEMWDLVDASNAHNRPLCNDINNYVHEIRLGHSPGRGNIARYFKWIFTTDNGAYTLFEVVPVPLS